MPSSVPHQPRKTATQSDHQRQSLATVQYSAKKPPSACCAQQGIPAGLRQTCLQNSHHQACNPVLASVLTDFTIVVQLLSDKPSIIITTITNNNGY